MPLNPMIASMLYGFGKKPGMQDVGTPPFVPQPGGGGFFQQADQALSRPNFLMNLLAQSGYSTTPGSPLAAVGRAGLMTQQQNQEAQQLQQQQGMSEIQRRLIESQIGRNQALSQKEATEADNPFGSVDPSKFTEESIAQFEQSGKYSDLKLRESSRLSTADIANHQYLQSLSPEDRELFFRGKRDPRFQSVEGVGFGAPNQATGEFDVAVPESVIVAGAEERKEAEARGSATGAGQGDQAIKGPVIESYKVAEQSVRDAMKNTPQGGPLGIAGRAGGLFDSQDAMKFDNSVQQLSTELRTLFRIPGEGTLSDREQEQYNLQLPKRTFKQENNEKILKDLAARANARVSTPIGGGDSSNVIDFNDLP